MSLVFELDAGTLRTASLDGARVVVTGAAGFIGRHLCQALVDCQVRRVVTVDPRPISPLSLGPVPRTEVVYAARSVLEPIDDLIDGADVVFHLAAHVSVPESVQDPLGDGVTNAVGTLSLLEACRRSGVKRFVHSSSSAVYGTPEYIPVDERHPTRPLSPYGLSKLTAERYALLFHELYGLSVVGLRYFNVYGPGQPVGGGYAAVIPLFLDRVARGLPVPIEGDGSQTRDFVHVYDVVAANLLAASSGFVGAVNVGSGRATSIGDLARLIGGPDYPIEWLAARLGDIQHSVADVTAARQQLGFSPAVSLGRGLASLAGTIQQLS